MTLYHIKKIENDFEVDVNKSSEAWKNADEITLQYLWDKFPYKPNVHVRCLYSTKYLYIRFEVEEDAIVSTATNINQPVHIDSCVEFFCAPELSKKGEYYNLEMNCCRNVYMAYGKPKRLGEREFVSEALLSKIKSSSTINGTTKELKDDDKRWEIEIKIPWEIYSSKSKNSVPAKGDKWMGNFYKCGDKLPRPHFGCWNKIKLESPDFHRPEFFGEIIFE
ncbi:MAG: hypothetical protein COA79_00690 [Planctomycetota bacterium]|nr:MAG: hypothetical protein COA79_00690 [Planctomycetota bacterium]